MMNTRNNGVRDFAIGAVVSLLLIASIRPVCILIYAIYYYLHM